MSLSYGTLRLSFPSGAEQELSLGKAEISLGRALTNDIVLPDPRVSREHARLECSPEGCTLVDLGSANKTYLNGQPVVRARLKFGDEIHMGEATLRFDPPSTTREPDISLIDSPAALDATLADLSLDMEINDTQTPRLAVHMPNATWEVPFTGEILTIGRIPGNDVLIEHPKVSRRHGRIERRGSSFVYRDLESTNGTWRKGQRIDTFSLQDGDMLQIGEAQVVFKRGFQAADLTLVDEGAAAAPRPRRPVVFVPGMMGSQLWLGSERIWPNVRYFFSNSELFRLGEDAPPVRAEGILHEFVIVPNLIKLEQYSRLGDYLVEELGYRREIDLLEFAYDWRRDVRLAARQLAQAIDAWEATPPVTIIAHSLGTLVSRYYIERLGGKRKVERLILLGGPHSGVPKAASSLLLRPDILPFGLMGDRIREIVSSFETSYQILPTYVCMQDQNAEEINLLDDESWLNEGQRPLLRRAREFRQELGMYSSVPTISIFGYGVKTVARLRTQRDRLGNWLKIDFESEPVGDGTIPSMSAVLPGTEIHPVQQHHGVLFVDNDVKMRLKLELTR